MAAGEAALMQVMRAIAGGEMAAASRLLAVSPSLAYTYLEHGATRH